MTNVDVREVMDHVDKHYAHADNYSAACTCGWTHRSPVREQSWRALKLHMRTVEATKRPTTAQDQQSGTRTPPSKPGASKGDE